MAGLLASVFGGNAPVPAPPPRPRPGPDLGDFVALPNTAPVLDMGEFASLPNAVPPPPPGFTLDPPEDYPADGPLPAPPPGFVIDQLPVPAPADPPPPPPGFVLDTVPDPHAGDTLTTWDRTPLEEAGHLWRDRFVPNVASAFRNTAAGAVIEGATVALAPGFGQDRDEQRALDAAQQAQNANLPSWSDEPTLAGRIVHGATALAGQVVGALPSPESYVGGSAAHGAYGLIRRGESAALPIARSFGEQAAVQGAANAGAQAINAADGTQKEFSPAEVAQSAGIGGVLGAGHALVGAGVNAVRGLHPDTVRIKDANGVWRVAVDRGVPPEPGASVGQPLFDPSGDPEGPAYGPPAPGAPAPDVPQADTWFSRPGAKGEPAAPPEPEPAAPAEPPPPPAGFTVDPAAVPPEPPKVEPAPVQPEPPKVEPAPVQPEPPKVEPPAPAEPPKVEPPAPAEPPKVEPAPVPPEPPKVEHAPVPPEPPEPAGAGTPKADPPAVLTASGKRPVSDSEMTALRKDLSRARDAYNKATRDPYADPAQTATLRDRLRAAQEAAHGAEEPPPRPTNNMGGRILDKDTEAKWKQAVQVHSDLVDQRIHAEGRPPAPDAQGVDGLFRLPGKITIVRGKDNAGQSWVGTGHALVLNTEKGVVNRAANRATKLKTVDTPAAPPAGMIDSVTKLPSAPLSPVTWERHVQDSEGRDMVVGRLDSGRRVLVQKPVYDTLSHAPGQTGMWAADTAGDFKGKMPAGDNRVFARDKNGNVVGVGMPFRAEQDQARVWAQGRDVPKAEPGTGTGTGTGTATGTATGTPKLTPPAPFHERLAANVAELDARGAPDTEYRKLLSTGSKDPLKPGETWRGKVLGIIEAEKRREGTGAGTEPAAAKGAKPSEPSEPSEPSAAAETAPGGENEDTGAPLHDEGAPVPETAENGDAPVGDGPTRTPLGGARPVRDFNEGTSPYREVFRDAGRDPDAMVSRPIREQVQVISQHVKNTFGFKDVVVDPKQSPKEARDQLSNFYQNAREMTQALGMPYSALGLNGRLTLTTASFREKSRYLGYYRPRDQVLHIPGRSNSFAHEWTHGLDHYLADVLANNPKGRLCRCVRRPQHLAHWVRLLRRGINLEITWFRQSFS